MTWSCMILITVERDMVVEISFSLGLSCYRDSTWVHTRAFKYNLSALGIYFECKGVKCTFLDLT